MRNAQVSAVGPPIEFAESLYYAVMLVVFDLHVFDRVTRLRLHRVLADGPGDEGHSDPDRFLALAQRTVGECMELLEVATVRHLVARPDGRRCVEMLSALAALLFDVQRAFAAQSPVHDTPKTTRRAASRGRRVLKHCVSQGLPGMMSLRRPGIEVVNG
jgi:hypothetical protein